LRLPKHPLILDEETKTQLEELRYACFERDDHQFGETGSLGAIFYGFPGTGKTKTAMQIIYDSFRDEIDK